MNIVSTPAPSTSTPIAKLLTGWLRFTDIEFRALLDRSSLARIQEIRNTLTQGREKLATNERKALAATAIARIDELIEIIDIIN